jgi:hypothetical protein
MHYCFTGKKKGAKMKVIFTLVLAVLLMPIPAFSIDPEEQKPLYKNETSGGRPATLRMMGEEENGELPDSFTGSTIRDAITTNKDGEIKGGRYKELEKMADDLLKNQIPGELPTPIGPAKTPIPHIYDRGAPDENEVEKNLNYDYETILNSETFADCMDYKVIDKEGCTKTMPDGTEVLTPFVKYHGPPQKVENVDQPLKTGYLTKDEVNKILSHYPADLIYRYAAQIGDYNIRYVTAMVKYQACLLELKGQNLTSEEQRKKCTLKVHPHKFGTAEEYSKKFIDDMKTGVVDGRFIFRNYDNPENGITYNEYHLMPTGIDLRYGRAFFQAFFEENVFSAFLRLLYLHWYWLVIKLKKWTPLFDTYVHYGPESGKIPREVFGDFPSHILVSRHTGLSVGMFEDLMLEKSYDPKLCAAWDRNFADNYEDLMNAKETVEKGGLKNVYEIDSDRKLSFDNNTTRNEKKNKKSTDAFRGTPYDMLIGLVDPGDYNPYSEKLCQGANQGSWLPLTNRVYTPYHAVAASIGTVRAIQAGAKLYPWNNYAYSYKNQGAQPEVNQDGELTKAHDGDKVQWLRNAYVDNPSKTSGDAEKAAKACHSVERWVKKFGEANEKHYSDKPGDKKLPSDMKEFKGGNWFVAAHWRYWRGCLNPFLEGTKPKPLPPYDKLGEVLD